MSTRELIALAVLAICVTAAYVVGHLAETQFVAALTLLGGYVGKGLVTATTPTAPATAKPVEPPWTPGP